MINVFTPTNIKLENPLQKNVASSILKTIGNTPLVALQHIKFHNKIEVFAKMESFNPGGSIKDRTAFSILENALQKGLLKKGGTIIESSSGNMAIGLAQACLFHNLKLIIVTDPKLNAQTERILLTYGAKLEKVTRALKDGGFLGSRLKKVNELLQQIPNSFWPNQYGNQLNPDTHEKTMQEIVEALQNDLDYIFITTSTCGTLMGCAQYILKNNLKTKIIAVDAKGSIIFEDKPGKRLIPGHGAGRKSEFLNKDAVYDVVHVSDSDCIEACWELLNREAILCGGSSGGALSALKKYGSNLPEFSKVALILCDRGERYLDTIYNLDWVQEHFPDLIKKGILNR